MILIKLDVSKIDKSKIIVGKKGKYLDLVLIEKPNAFGDDGFVAQGVSKEGREAGERGAIVGNWRNTGSKRPQPEKLDRGWTPTADEDSDIPF